MHSSWMVGSFFFFQTAEFAKSLLTLFHYTGFCMGVPMYVNYEKQTAKDKDYDLLIDTK